jgi:hypothetical protein
MLRQAHDLRNVIVLLATAFAAILEVGLRQTTAQGNHGLGIGVTLFIFATIGLLVGLALEHDETPSPTPQIKFPPLAPIAPTGIAPRPVRQWQGWYEAGKG